MKHIYLLNTDNRSNHNNNHSSKIYNQALKSVFLFYNLFVTGSIFLMRNPMLGHKGYIMLPTTPYHHLTDSSTTHHVLQLHRCSSIKKVDVNVKYGLKHKMSWHASPPATGSYCTKSIVMVHGYLDDHHSH